MPLILIAILPFLGALLPGLMIRAGRNACAWSAAVVTLGALVGLLAHAPAVFAGEVVQYRLDWLPVLGLNANFFLDGLGLLFAGMILGIGLLIIVYARFYLSREDPMGQFFTYLLLFQGAMVGIVLSDNVLLLLIFWELTSLSSFLLIGYWKHLPEGRQGARMALAVTGMGGLALIGGMLLLGEMAGSYDLSVILQNKAAIQASPLYVPALILILLGCFTKSAQFPFHFWLPHAMAAPTPVSAYLHSATMVKAGLYLMARLWPVLSGTPEWFYIVATTGLVTMLAGALIALFKDDLKALLAFSTVSHLGLITMLLGFGTPLAAVVAVFHIMNHATFKAALFLTVGIIDHEAHTRDIKRLGGLRHLMPIVFVIGTVAALSMAGLPPLNGFLSKEMMLEEAAHTVWAGTPWLVPVLVTFSALLSAAYAFRFVSGVFLGPERHDYPATPHDPGPELWLAPALLVVIVVVIGIMPAAVAGGLLEVASRAVTGGMLPEYTLKIWHGFNPALLMSAIATAGGLVVLSLLRPLDRLRLAVPRPDAKAIFDWTMTRLVAMARGLTGGLHNGAMTRYSAVFALTVGLAGAAAWLSGTPGAATRGLMPLTIVPLIGWLLVMVATAGIIVLHHNRLLALILMGVNGLIVSIGFAYFSAPDLALTQASVEVVTIILLLLALNFLPKYTPREGSSGRHVRDAVIAIGAGLGTGLLTMAIQMTDFTQDSIAGYHLANAKPGGGGTNVVNVILVDFRGFDTFGEIIVLGIAALVIYALIEVVLDGPVGKWLANRPPDPGEAGDSHPLIMVVATRVMMPIALIVGVFIFLRGHNEPGGGFIAGLIVAIALVMQYMASGFDWAAARQRFPYHGIVAMGIFAALVTGAGSWLAGRPFLTSSYGYFKLPLIEKFELATAMAFDTGVFLCVVGAVMLALESLSRLAHRPGERPSPYPMDVDPSRVAAEEKA
ncbi:monovalent cation/H+ antiporter subunit A [Aestuariivirga sp.]|uniref:monovalent cation/H+ antiporter subunit A n=1 Tax=Aestuariivirga sp. TaxID=2650926 RepID=UPI003593CB35